MTAAFMTDRPSIEMNLAHIRIVLVEPAGPLNVGAIARVMKNMGLSQLVLVNPACDPLHPDAQKMAVHAPELLHNAHIVPHLPDALSGCQRAIATTARERSAFAPLQPPAQCLPWLFEATSTRDLTPPPAALIFGPEDRGLSNTELNYAHRFLCIPSSPIYPSLNLAQAVAICGYELHQLAQSEEQPDATNAAIAENGTPFNTPNTGLSEPVATLDAIEGYYQHLENLLLNIGYLYPHTAASRMEKFRRFLNRAAPTETELAMLRGIIRQMEWALKQESKHSSIH